MSVRERPVTPAVSGLPIYVVTQGNQVFFRAAPATVLGDLVVLELQAAGTLYTVPANVTFNGLAYIVGAGSGNITLSAATGGVVAHLQPTSGSGATNLSKLTVAGGGTGNALTVATTGATITSVTIVGYVK